MRSFYWIGIILACLGIPAAAQTQQNGGILKSVADAWCAKSELYPSLLAKEQATSVALTTCQRDARVYAGEAKLKIAQLEGKLEGSVRDLKAEKSRPPSTRSLHGAFGSTPVECGENLSSKVGPISTDFKTTSEFTSTALMDSCTIYMICLKSPEPNPQPYVIHIACHTVEETNSKIEAIKKAW